MLTNTISACISFRIKSKTEITKVCAELFCVNFGLSWKWIGEFLAVGVIHLIKVLFKAICYSQHIKASSCCFFYEPHSAFELPLCMVWMCLLSGFDSLVKKIKIKIPMVSVNLGGKN